MNDDGAADLGPAVRVAVVDDHELLRLGVGAKLASAGYELGASTKSVEELVAAEQHTTQSDFVVLDVLLPDQPDVIDNMAALREAGYERIVIITMHYAAVPLKKALNMGAAALVAKNDDASQLIDALDSLRRDPDGFLSSFMARVIASSGLVQFTQRQEDVLRLLSAGLSTKDMALELCIKPSSVLSAEKEIKARYRAVYPELAAGVEGGERFTRATLRRLAEMDGYVLPPLLPPGS